MRRRRMPRYGGCRHRRSVEHPSAVVAREAFSHDHGDELRNLTADRAPRSCPARRVCASHGLYLTSTRHGYGDRTLSRGGKSVADDLNAPARRFHKRRADVSREPRDPQGLVTLTVSVGTTKDVASDPAAQIQRSRRARPGTLRTRARHSVRTGVARPRVAHD